MYNKINYESVEDSLRSKGVKLSHLLSLSSKENEWVSFALTTLSFGPDNYDSWNEGDGKESH